MTLGQYLVLVNLYLILFYGFYALLLRKETFFQLNRGYLIGSVFLSSLIPVLQADWLQELFVTKEVQQVMTAVDPKSLYLFTVTGEKSLTLGEVLYWVYLAGVGVTTLKLVYQIMLLRKQLSAKVHKAAFSFFNRVQVSPELPQQDIILAHEQVHVKQWHSADVLFFELLAITQWFNPVVYLYRRSIKKLHEYIADEQTVRQTINRADYARLLLLHALQGAAPVLVNQFFNQSLLKQRIMMLGKKKSRQVALWKYTLSAPLFAGMLILSSATFRQSNSLQIISEKAEVVLSTSAVPQAVTYETISPVEYKGKSSEGVQHSSTSEVIHKESSVTTKRKAHTVVVSRKVGLNSFTIAKQDTVKKTGNRTIVGTVTPKQDSSAKFTIRIKETPSTDVNAKKPLYLVNGKEIEADAISKINPNDIASIDVLKGDKAKEKYGSKADNGVVEITLKVN